MKVAIIGAGISGLSTAYYLNKAGVSTVLLEAGTTVGGLMQTTHRGGFLAESAANAILANQHSDIMTLIGSLGLDEELVKANTFAKVRYVLKNNRLKPVPTHPLQLLMTDLLSWRGKLRLLREPWIRAALHEQSKEESLAAFAERRFGEEIAKTFIDPLATGIYAGDPEQLSAQSAFPHMVDLERRHGSVLRGALQSMRKRDPSLQAKLVSLRLGMGSLLHSLAAALPPQSLHLGVQVKGIEQYRNGWRLSCESASGVSGLAADHLVIATGVKAAAALVYSYDGQLGDLLTAIPTASVISATVGWPRQRIGHSLAGYGFLVPAGEQRKLLGVIFSSSLFQCRAAPDQVTLTCMLGGVRNPRLLDLNDNAIIEIIQTELEEILGAHGEPTFVKIHRWRDAIPQYSLRHQGIMHSVDGTIAKRRLALCFTGNYIDGISIAHCVERAKRVATSVAAHECGAMVNKRNMECTTPL